ncbi:MAG: glycosyltransferase family 9 protein [Deltaproteobacteria bacterium]|nr:glycosyltransferase family 9 protein [Deltaproteobacteria bacterium]
MIIHTKIRLMKRLDQLFGPHLAAIVSCRKNRKPVSAPDSILLIRPGGIGDAVLLIPILRFLAQLFPQANITILAEKRNAGVFLMGSRLASVYCYDRPLDLLKVLKNRYELVIDTEQWHYLSAVIAGIVGRYRIGFATNKRRRVFTDAIDYSHKDYELQSFVRLLEPLVGDSQPAFNPPFLHIPSSIKSAAELLPHLTAPYVVLFPGASIDERKWGSDRFAELGRQLMSAGFKVVVVGGNEDIGLAAEIESNLPGVINLAGKTSLLETASVLSGAALLISGDSGILHIGVGLGIPTVSLFGPGIAEKWAPRGPRHRVVNLELPCSPCTRFGTTPPCPIGARCIQDISVDRVFQEAMELLPAFASGG